MQILLEGEDARLPVKLEQSTARRSDREYSEAAKHLKSPRMQVGYVSSYVKA